MIFFWPDYRKGNPYQKSLYSEMQPEIYTAGPIEKALSALRKEAPKKIFFHLHWTHRTFGKAETEKEFRKLTKEFLTSIDKFLKRGGIFIWTIHNVSSHDSKFADLERKFHEDIARRADLVLLHEAGSVSIVRREFRLIESRVRILPHGNYLDSYPNFSSKTEARERLNIPKDKDLVFGFVGMLRPYKGVEEFIKAVGLASQDKKGSINAFIAGKPSSPFSEGDVYRLAADVEGMSVFEGFIPDDELHYYLNAADIIVLPYRRILTSGSVILAASFGRPVLLPRLESFEDLVDLPFVFTYEPDDIEDMASKLQELRVLTATELGRLSQVALDWAKTRDWQTIGKQLEGYLDEVENSREAVDLHICEQGIDHRVQVYNPEKNGQLYDIAICIVNYRSIDDLRTLQRTLQRHVVVRWRMLILDNSEQDSEFEKLKAGFPDAVLVRPNENLGYAAGNNVLMAMAKNAGFPAIGILNPDVWLDKDCISTMVSAVRHAPNALHSLTVAKQQKSGKTVVSFLTSKISSVNGGLRLEHLHKGIPVKDLGSEVMETDSLSGCAMFFASELIEEHGYLPEGYFLYFEETDWTYRMKLKGVPLLVHTETFIVHSKASQKHGLPSLPYVYYLLRGAILFAKEFGFSVKETEDYYRKTFVRQWTDKLDNKSKAFRLVFLKVCDLAFEDANNNLGGPVNILERLSEKAKQSKHSESLGFLETVDSGKITGWAGSKCWFWRKKVLLAVFSGDRFVGEIIPGIHREDVKKLGFKATAGFSFSFPENYSPSKNDQLMVVNANTGTLLETTEQYDQQLRLI